MNNFIVFLHPFHQTVVPTRSTPVGSKSREVVVSLQRKSKTITKTRMKEKTKTKTKTGTKERKKNWQETYATVEQELVAQLAACVDDRNVTDDTDDTGVF